VSFAVFDDRVEVWSAGAFPSKITAESLSREHGSYPRNPFIAEVFFRAGLIEKWGRGTNRVIEMCRRHGIAAPEFEQVGPSVVVRFRVKVGTTRVTTTQVSTQVTTQVAAVLEAARRPRSGSELQKIAKIQTREYFRRAYLDRLLRAGWIERTVPDKPRSRLQRYRTTEAGLRALEGGTFS
jgi:ATP-dependent DNA helicase RecG